MGPRQHYLDYTGSSLYTRSQLEATFAELQSCTLGNPHSENPSSHSCGERVDLVREEVLRYFQADPGEYQVIFTRQVAGAGGAAAGGGAAAAGGGGETAAAAGGALRGAGSLPGLGAGSRRVSLPNPRSGATGALKMVGEYFPWDPQSHYRYLRENHNSVLGIREYAKAAGAAFESYTEAEVERWLAGDDSADSRATDPRDLSALARSAGLQGPKAFHLFAYPAQENYAGSLYPLGWIEAAHRRSTAEQQWLVLLDAAAFIPTHPLNLSVYKPDFVALSFYKVFGYPTGLGALVVRTDAVSVLNKRCGGWHPGRRPFPPAAPPPAAPPHGVSSLLLSPSAPERLQPAGTGAADPLLWRPAAGTLRCSSATRTSGWRTAPSPSSTLLA